MKRSYKFLLLLIGATLLFEAEGPYIWDGWSRLGWYFHADLSSWFPLHIVVSPLEIGLILLVVFWLLRDRRALKTHRFQTGTLLTPLLVFGGLVALGLVNGLLRGGDNITMGLWEIRGFAVMIVSYMLVGMYIRRERDLNDIVWVVLIASTAMAIENVLRAILFPTEVAGSDLAYDHIDSIVIAFATVLCIGLLTFGATRAQRRYAMFALPLFLICLEVMRRRAAFVVIVVGLLFLVLFLLRLRPRIFWKVVPPIVLILSLYLAAFWTDTSALGQPARAISSQFTPDPRDAASNAYRVIEKLDIVANIQTAPLTGLGFGQQFYFFYALPNLGTAWPFWLYQTHNAVLWVWMKDGLLGFMAFFWLLGRAVYDGARNVETQREEWDFVARLRARLSSRHATDSTWETATAVPDVLLRPSAAAKRFENRSPHAMSRSGRRSTPLATSAVYTAPAKDRDVSFAAPPTIPLRHAHSAASTLGLNVPGWERTDHLRSVTAQRSGAVALVVAGICLVPMQLVYSYVDLGLTSARGMLLFGLMLGIIARAPALLGVVKRDNRRKARVEHSSAKPLTTALRRSARRPAVVPVLTPEEVRDRMRTLVNSRALSRPLTSSRSRPLADRNSRPLQTSTSHPLESPPAPTPDAVPHTVIAREPTSPSPDGPSEQSPDSATATPGSTSESTTRGRRKQRHSAQKVAAAPQATAPEVAEPVPAFARRAQPRAEAPLPWERPAT